MKAFVTGASGFIGGHVVRKLLGRGYQVKALVRSPQDAAEMKLLGAEPVEGDILNPDSFREAMTGCDVVFHIAGWYEIGSRDWRTAELVNVEGTRSVLGTAHQVGVPRIVYTSTVAVFGDTRGKLVDESYRRPDRPFLTEYDRTKWEAHYRVALPMIERGAPIIIVQPGAVYGPEDHSLYGELMQRFYKSQMVALPGPMTALCFSHVEDCAEGHILAAEQGRIGESYIIGGPVLTLREAVGLWSQVTGRAAPRLEVPARFLTPLAPVVGALEQVLPLPKLVNEDAVKVLGVTYIARSEKAHRELGWFAREPEEGFRQTFDWIAGRTQPPGPPSVRRKRAASFSLGAAIGLLLVWLYFQYTKRR